MLMLGKVHGWFIYHLIMFESNILTKILIFIFPQAFGDDFLEDKLKPFYKSDPVPESVCYLIFPP